MVSKEISVLERELMPRRAVFEQMLAQTDLAPMRLIRSVITAYENTITLHECSISDIINVAQTAGYLGVIVDGVTGQGWIAPFKDKRSGRTRAQLMIGYRGYATIAARAHLSINADVVRQGDKFTVQRGTRTVVDHQRKLGGEADRAIEAAWATAEAYDRPPIVSVMSFDQIIAIRDRAQSYRAGGGSPWRTDFPAMALKTPVRDLGRFIPMSAFSHAAQMENLHDHHGAPVNVTPQGEIVIDARVDVGEPGTVELPSPPSIVILKPNSTVACASIADWRAKMLMAVEALEPEKLRAFLTLNAAPLAEYARGYPGDVAVVKDAGEKKLGATQT